MKNTKRIISVITALILVLTMCAVTATANGNAPVYTEVKRTESNYSAYTYANDDYAALGNNLISGIKATVYALNDDLSHTVITNLDNADAKLAMLTDGAVEDSGDGASRAQLFYTGGDPLPKVDLEYDLGGSCTIDKFALISLQNTRDFDYYGKFYTGKYEVYLSDSITDLYDAENMIYAYDYSVESERAGAQFINFNVPVSGKYLAIRILDTLSLTGEETGKAYPRIAEIGLFGSEIYTETLRSESNHTSVSYSDSDYSAFGNNLISGVKGSVYALNDDLSERTLVTNLNDADNQLAMLTDGAVTDSGDGKSRAQLYYNGGADLPKIDIEYDLGVNCSIDKFALISIQNTKDFDYYGKFYAGKYEVYLSNDKEDLYKAENLVYSYDYTTIRERSGAQFVDFENTVSGRYVAIRILDPLSLIGEETGSAKTRIAEIGVFGTADYTVQHRTESNYTTTGYTNDTYAALGTNLLSGKLAETYVPAEDGLSHSAVTNLDNAATKLAMLTDGAVEDPGTGASRAQLFVTGGGELPKIDLEYDLGTTCTVDKFALISMQNTKDFPYYSKFYTGKYEVYMSDNQADLYNAENLVYTYDYTEVAERSGAQVVTFNKKATGRYFAVRILNPLSLEGEETAKAYARIAEIGLFGKIDNDVNGDGVVDICDLVRLSLYLNDNNVEIANGDIDKSGVIDLDDLSALRTILLNN